MSTSARTILTTLLALLCLFSPAQASAGERKLVVNQDADYFGGDYKTLKKVKLEACKAACLGEARCKAFTYNARARWCFLKQSVGELKSFKGAIAGRVIAAKPTETAAAPSLPPPGVPDFLPAGIEREAVALTKRLTPAQGLPDDAVERARALVVEGDEAIAAGQFRVGADRYAGAAGLAAARADIWLKLATAVVKVEPANNTERYQLPQMATSAALNAYLASRDRQTRAAALAALGAALARRNYNRAALESYKASLALADSAPVRAAFDALYARFGFRVTGHSVDAESASPRICIKFSEDLKRTGDDLAKFITIAGRTASDVRVEQRQICVGGVKHGQTYQVGVRAGVTAKIGEVISKPVSLTVYVRDRKAGVRFAGDRFVLPAFGRRALPVVSVNADEADIAVYRIGERALSRLLSKSKFLRQLDKWEAESVADQLGARIWNGVVTLKRRLNVETTTLIPLDKVLAGAKPGVFVMTARARGDTSQDWTPLATQWFVVSDLGLSTYAGSDGLNVFVRALSSARPVAGVRLTLVARNNEILGQAVSDADGRATFVAGAMRGTGGLTPSVVVARGDNGEFVFLDLTRAGFDLSDRGVAGRPAPGPVDLFMYTERGIYRPGARVHVAALARSAETGRAQTGTPLTFVFSRPDGVEYRRLVSIDRGAGGHYVNLDLPQNAMRGAWRVEAYVDPKGKALFERRFLVENFVPDRIEFDLKAEADRLTRAGDNAFTVDGRYLYGAPAAALRLEGEMLITGADALADFKGYHFGLAGEDTPAQRIQLDNLPLTDESGKARFTIALDDLPAATGPLKATVSVRMREAGARAVERRLTLPVVTGRTMIGIKPAFDGDSIGQGETARFTVIAVDGQLKPTGLAGARWRLLKVERSYQWYRTDSGWNYEPVTYTRQVGAGDVDIAAEKGGEIAAPVQWGRYRLEVESGDGDHVAASYVFTAGWYVEASAADTPDALEVALDKASYAPGDVAHVRIAAQFSGQALVIIGGESVREVHTATLTARNGSIDIPVKAEWGAGVYVTVTLFRPGRDGDTARNPHRAIGLAWLKIDPGKQRLQVRLDVADKMRPQAPLKVAVNVGAGAAGERAFVMVSAVDVGILNLTRYKKPQPDAWFSGQRRLGLELRDIYGRLIEIAQGALGSVRSGGDEAGLSTTGSPPREKLVAFFSGPVEVDENGIARVAFDIPAFNGTVRVMAVAWSAAGTGSASADVVVRDPLVLTLSAPRFLAPGDSGFARLDVVNADGPPGDYQLEATGSGDIRLATAKLPTTLTLAAGGKAALAIPFTAGEPGAAAITVRLARAAGPSIERSATLEVRPAQPPLTRRTQTRIAAGDSLTIDRNVLAGGRIKGASVRLHVARTAGIDVPDLLRALDRYPYGCAEQATSRALPLMYLSGLARKYGLDGEARARERVQKAIDRVLAYQSDNGGFSLWGTGLEDVWLSAYVTEFLSRAREESYTVPERAFKQALDYLQNRLSYDNAITDKGSEIAYALYVLARNRRASIGDLRYYVDVKLAEFSQPLARAHLGAALALYGESERAKVAFVGAIGALDAAASKSIGYDHYGSNLRDAAAILALAAEANPAPTSLDELAARLARLLAARTYVSTQENAFSLLAARALSLGKGVKLAVNGEVRQGDLFEKIDAEALAASPVPVKNLSATPVYASITTSARPDRPLPATAKGFAITRQYYTLDGKPADISTIAQNTRLVVVLSVREDNAHASRIVVSDLLPAGFEIDNPSLVKSADLAGFDWLENVSVAHSEFRKDRFVAALNRTARDSREFRLAYVVRAVWPGKFILPPAHVEDMYRPYLFATTAAGTMEVVGPRP